MSQFLLVGTAVEPLSLAEARQWLRIDSTHDDDIVSTLIVSARLLVEQTTRRLLIAQQWRILLDDWPIGGMIEIPLTPVLSIDAFRLRAPSGEATPVNPETYRLRTHQDPAVVELLSVPSAELALRGGIELDVTAGYGAQAIHTPEPLRHAIRLLVAGWYENRGDAAFGQHGAQLPSAVASLLAPFRRMRLS